MKLLLIRHGESEADILGVHEGRADFGLTAKGRDQAGKMSAWVKERYAVDKIYCSSLIRARQTAEYLSSAFDLPLNAEDRLREFNNGLLAGLTFDEADRLYPEARNLPAHQSVYEQESALDFRFRAEYMLSQIISENGASDTVAVISHGGTINQMFKAFIGAPVGSGIFVHTGDTGIHELIADGDRRGIAFMNSLCHLR